MTILERINAIDDIHTMLLMGEIDIIEAWECIETIVTGTCEGITWH